MGVDVIILANTQDLFFYGLLQRTINTLLNSETNINFNIIVVETNTNYLNQGFVSTNVAKIITPNETFNYNRFLNIGLKECKNEWIIIANNDLIFGKNWLSAIFKIQANNPEILSFSPRYPNWHYHQNLNSQEFYLGHRVAQEITGWCIVLHSSVIQKCKLFDESFVFWYQDNDYAMSLKHNNIPHALIRDSIVYHDTSRSHHLLGHNLENYTNKQELVYKQKWN